MDVVISWFEGISLAGLLQIIVSDIVLSGDNALLIGAIAASLEGRQRRLVIILGGIGAATLRIALTAAATMLLSVPLLQAGGAVALYYIAINLLRERNKEHHSAKKSGGIISALWAVLVADLMMSIDNVLAVAGIASGHMPTLVIGMLVSIALLMVGSTLVAKLMKKLPWLLDLASLSLGWTTAKMLLEDPIMGSFLTRHIPGAHWIVPVVIMTSIAVVDVVILRRARRNKK
ncbi:YjbE family putative metal transport protein [Ktedonospora formicarum]|uniref:Membrane protein n=1 Tax=Ktedonospora formicarum TaxID=2778364 RepID=A0A8J3I6I5_9CHLR|nr:YjbE family putative metal transport protein [Ktedonospora formicarum]GHO49566.1 membrane protein [Ktedonospora formicarum]